MTVNIKKLFGDIKYHLKPKIIDRYVFTEIMPNYIAGLSVFFLVTIIKQIFKLASYYFERNTPLDKVLDLFIFVVPYTLAMSIPISVVIATTMAYNRLSADSEIISMRASGIAPIRILIPSLWFGLVIGILSIIYFDTVLIWGNQNYVKAFWEMQTAKPTVQMEPGVFVKIGKGNAQISFDRIDRKEGMMYGIHIINKTGDKEQIIEAEKGMIVSDSAKPNYYSLKLINGTFIEKQINKKKGEETKKNFFIASFVNGTINIEQEIKKSRFKDHKLIHARTLWNRIQRKLGLMNSEIKKKKDKLIKKENELEKLELKMAKQPDEEVRKKIEKLKKDIDKIRKDIDSIYRARYPREDILEFWKKFSIPLSCIPFAIIGAPLGIFLRRTGKSGAIGFSIVIIVAYYTLNSLGSIFGKKGMISPVLGAWLPDIVLGGIGIILILFRLRR